jgi:hypothetical protein
MNVKRLPLRSPRRPEPRAWAWTALLTALTILAWGCGSSGSLRLYVNPDADMTFYKRVAILPFTNLSTDPFAGQRVTRAFTTELVISERFDLVEEGEFHEALRSAAVEPDIQGYYDPARVAKVAGDLKATALIKGTVTDYQIQRFGSQDFPVLSFDVEMIDLQSGGTVWRGSVTRHGGGGTPVVGGSGTRTFGKLVQECSEEMVKKLESEAF